MGVVCKHRGCSTQASFGLESSTSKRVEFCRAHKSADMVDVINKKCAHQGCTKIRTFGDEIIRKAEFCSEHKTVGMVDLCHKLCHYEGCSKRASFGMEVTRKAESCGEHRRAGMVDVKSKRCSYEGCCKVPCFGREGSKKPELCGAHREAGMVNVRHKRCAYQGCSKQLSYSKEGRKKAKFCCEHNKCSSEGCVERAVCVLDISNRRVVLCAGHFTEQYQAPSAPATAKEREEGQEMEEEAGGEIALLGTRKRAVRVEDLPQQVHETSCSSDCGRSTGKRQRAVEGTSHDASREGAGFVRELSPTLSLADLLPSATQDSNGPPPAALWEQLLLTEGVTLTNTRGLGAVAMAGIAGSGDGVLGGNRGGKRVEAGDRGVSVAYHRAGAEQDISTVVRQGPRDISASSCEDQRKSPPLEQEKKGAMAEVKNLLDRVAQLESKVAHVAVEAANSVPDASRHSKGKDGDTIQALRDELSAAWSGLKDSQGALKVACEERKALRQQAQVASAASTTKANAADMVKVKEYFHQHVESLRAELTATSTGWKNTKKDLEVVREERDALRWEELHAELIVASTGLDKTKDDLSVVRHERDALYKEAQETPVTDAVNPRSGIPASLLQSMMIGLARIASPAALVVAAAAAQSSAEAPESQFPASAAAAGTAGEGVGKGEVDGSMGLCERENEEAGQRAAAPLRYLDESTVAIQPES